MLRNQDAALDAGPSRKETTNRGMDAVVGRATGLLKGVVSASGIIGAGMAVLGAFGLVYWSGVQRELFCHGAAWLAGGLSGSRVVRVEEGWMLESPIPAVVTGACSGTTYFLLVAALVGWHLGKRSHRATVAAIAAVGCSVPLAIAINAVRIVVVTQAHRWAIPHFPQSYGPFLHMLTGLAVFLPAFIALNIFFETHGRSSTHVESRN